MHVCGHGSCRFVYALSGVSVHSGMLGAGHYIAYVKTEAGWFHVSDSSVSPASRDAVMRSQAYLLFYTLLPADAVLPTPRYDAK